jgi:hypothetical protein
LRRLTGFGLSFENRIQCRFRRTETGLLFGSEHGLICRRQCGWTSRALGPGALDKGFQVSMIFILLGWMIGDLARINSPDLIEGASRRDFPDEATCTPLHALFGHCDSLPHFNIQVGQHEKNADQRNSAGRVACRHR